MGKGRRYNGENNKLNIKKVIAVTIAIIVVVMFIIAVIKVINLNGKGSGKNVTVSYYTIYDEGKWGVINAKGNIVIDANYDEMIVIPNPEKDIFIVTYDVDYNSESYKTKAINSKNIEMFTEYDNIEAIQNQDEQNSIWYATGCLKTEKNGKYGLIDLSGKVLADCMYDEITPLLNVKNSLITVKDGKKGLISTTGTVVIDNAYEEIKALTESYEDGYVVKDSNGNYGVIGTNKKIVVPIEYSEIKSVKSNSKYVVKKSEKLIIFNSDSATETTIEADDVTSINSENVIIKKADKYGIMTSSGEIAVSTEYQLLRYIFSDYYIAKLNDNYGVISSAGDVKLEFEYSNLTYRKDADFIEGNKIGTIESEIIDRNLQVKLTGIISTVNVDKGYMKIRIGSEYKYYNFKYEEKKNTEILTSNTLFLSKQNGKYGYVNKDGVVVVNYIYDDATEQNNSGYVAVKKDGKWGALDENGNTIVETTLELNNNTLIDFIGEWHLAEDANAGYYTK